MKSAESDVILKDLTPGPRNSGENYEISGE